MTYLSHAVVHESHNHKSRGSKTLISNCRSRDFHRTFLHMQRGKMTQQIVFHLQKSSASISAKRAAQSHMTRRLKTKVYLKQEHFRQAHVNRVTVSDQGYR